MCPTSAHQNCQIKMKNHCRNVIAEMKSIVISYVFQLVPSKQLNSKISIQIHPTDFKGFRA